MTTRSWVQDPVTGELVPKAEYRRRAVDAHIVMRPFEPIITDEGERVTTRRQLAGYLNATGQCSAHEHDGVMADHDRHTRERKAADREHLHQTVVSAVNEGFENVR